MAKIFLNKTKGGFTLIELLVVLAIIVLIVSIGLTYLLNTQKSGKDTRIISNMDLFRKRANLVYQTEGDFDNICCGVAPCDSDIKKLCDDADNLNGGFGGISVNKPASPSQSYCAEIKLNSGDWYCVDSTLESKQYGADPDCLAGDYTCATD